MIIIAKPEVITDQLMLRFCPLRRRSFAAGLLLACLSLASQTVQGQALESAHHEIGTREIDSREPILIPECRVNLVNEVSLSCERAGILEFVALQGAVVRQGEVIVRLRDAIARSTYLIAERESSNDIEIRFARKASELAQLKYERAQQADQAIEGTVTEFELRELRLAAERSLLQLQQAEHQFEISGLRKQEQLEILRSYQITAPFDAFVRVAIKKPNEYVREGEVVLELVNDGLIRVEGFVDVRDLPYVMIGNQVAVYMDDSSGERKSFPGRITFVDTKIEPVSMRARVTAQVSNVNSILKDGLLVTMAITPGSQPQRTSQH